MHTKEGSDASLAVRAASDGAIGLWKRTHSPDAKPFTVRLLRRIYCDRRPYF